MRRETERRCALRYKTGRSNTNQHHRPQPRNRIREEGKREIYPADSGLRENVKLWYWRESGKTNLCECENRWACSSCPCSSRGEPSWRRGSLATTSASASSPSPAPSSTLAASPPLPPPQQREREREGDLQELVGSGKPHTKWEASPLSPLIINPLESHALS